MALPLLTTHWTTNLPIRYSREVLGPRGRQKGVRKKEKVLDKATLTQLSKSPPPTKKRKTIPPIFGRPLEKTDVHLPRYSQR